MHPDDLRTLVHKHPSILNTKPLSPLDAMTFRRAIDELTIDRILWPKGRPDPQSEKE